MRTACNIPHTKSPQLNEPTHQPGTFHTSWKGSLHAVQYNRCCSPSSKSLVLDRSMICSKRPQGRTWPTKMGVCPAVYSWGYGTHAAQHMKPAEALLLLLAPAMLGKSLSWGSRSSTITDVSSLRPPCARWIAVISFSGASCQKQDSQDHHYRIDSSHGNLHTITPA